MSLLDRFSPEERFYNSDAMWFDDNCDYDMECEVCGRYLSMHPIVTIGINERYVDCVDKYVGDIVE